MPRMIPELPSENTKSGAELKLFRRLREMEDSDDWVVLHSLAIARHETQSQGEADFVVVIPSCGTLVLEVKGGRISHNNGKWFSKDANDAVHQIKNPIEEANNAMHSIKDYVESLDSSQNLSKTLFGFGVVFPDTTIHGIVRSVEIADEQIADFDDCCSPQDLRSYLLKLSEYWNKRKTQTITSPNSSQCKAIVEALRPSFESRVLLRSLIRSIENQVIELTENQQDVFETITENERCIIRGGAGTGKTVIAMHYARQLADEGIRTGFFCYNRQLAAFLQNSIESSERFVCDSFTDYMASVAERAGHIHEPFSSFSEKDKYYRDELPQLFMEAFIELDLPPFDCLVLDEAQDLLTKSYLEAFDLALQGGLSGGRWYFFMDAEKQNLFQTGQSEAGVLDLLHGFQKNYTKCVLRDNCRNSVAIIEKVDSVFGGNTRHKHNNERGAEVVVKSYKKTGDEAATLETILRTLDREGVTREQIVILSPTRFQNSVASLIENTPITNSINDRESAVFFSTIHSFKGLESPVVILTDIDSLSDEKRMNVLYVGMTRAKSALYILAQEKAAKLLR